MRDYIDLGAMLTAICLISGWVVIAARVHYLVKMVVATIAVVLAIGIWTKSAALIGYPVHGMPPDGGEVLALQVDKTEIAFWMAGQPPRSYAIPYDPDLANKLTQAQDKARRTGGRMILHLHGKPGGGGDDGQDTNGNVAGGRGGGQRYGGGTMFDDNAAPVTIDVVPALPEK